LTQKRQRLSAGGGRLPTNITPWSSFDVATGTQAKAKPNAPAYQNCSARASKREAEKDDKDRRQHAAIASGPGIDIFNKAFPKRT